ncbi:hypothetical protein ACFWY5_38970 [Nonomuraea sp. NPDC059007]|uniref:hypothetical protein n=1 Tax=Nonomuraea sp. NPDC059007 TaxID=3346692 RepID=UPI0036CAF36F
MTLVLALASEHQLHMTCDFKLTDGRNGKPLTYNAHKLVTIQRPTIQAIIGFTGIANFDKTPVGVWLAEKTAGLPQKASLDMLIATLHDATAELEKVPKALWRFRRITFVIGAIQGSQTVVAIMSNFQNLRGIFLADQTVPASTLQLSVTRPSKPTLFAAGDAYTIRKDERKTLERSLRADIEPELLRGRLASLNKKIAGRTHTVSQGCNSASIFASGHGASEAFLIEQTGDFIPPDVQEMFNRFGIKINRGTLPDGSPASIQIRSATSVSYSPSPKYFQEQLKLRPKDSQLWNNFGAYENHHGRQESARAAFQKALDLDSGNHLAARNMGWLLWEMGDNPEEARRLFDIALTDPEPNRRRETFTVLAESLLLFEGDIKRAHEAFRKAMAGEFLPLIAAKYSWFLLQYKPELIREARSLAEASLQMDQNILWAVLTKAYCIWHLDHDSNAAWEMLVKHASKFEKDTSLTASTLHLSLVANRLDSADVLHAKLARSTRATKAGIASFAGILNLCHGGALDKSAEWFAQSNIESDRINLAAVRWGQGKILEAHDTLMNIRKDRLTASAAIEHMILQYLLASCHSSTAETALSEIITSKEVATFDETLFRSLAHHHEISPKDKTKLEKLISAINRAKSNRNSQGLD